jgi:hypothetical protein
MQVDRHRLRMQSGGSPQKKLKATDPPLTVSDVNLCLSPNIAWRWELPMKLPPEPGSGCGGRWQTEKEAAGKKLGAAKQTTAPKKEKAAKKNAA